jgi:hypothetical protein
MLSIMQFLGLPLAAAQRSYSKASSELYLSLLTTFVSTINVYPYSKPLTFPVLSIITKKRATSY